MAAPRLPSKWFPAADGKTVPNVAARRDETALPTQQRHRSPRPSLEPGQGLVFRFQFDGIELRATPSHPAWSKLLAKASGAIETGASTHDDICTFEVHAGKPTASTDPAAVSSSSSAAVGLMEVWPSKPSDSLDASSSLIATVQPDTGFATHQIKPVLAWWGSHCVSCLQDHGDVPRGSHPRTACEHGGQHLGIVTKSTEDLLREASRNPWGTGFCFRCFLPFQLCSSGPPKAGVRGRPLCAFAHVARDVWIMFWTAQHPFLRGRVKERGHDEHNYPSLAGYTSVTREEDGHVITQALEDVVLLTIRYFAPHLA